MGAPAGNQNAARSKVWRAAIERALDKRAAQSGVDRAEALNCLAEALLYAASTGDLAALKELGDRLDGKPAQAIVGGDETDGPVKILFAWKQS